MAILSNVYRDVELPSGPRHSEFKPGKGRSSVKRKLETEVSQAEKRRQYRLIQIQSLDKSDRQRILSLKDEPTVETEKLSAEKRLEALPEEVRQDLETKLLDMSTCRKAGTLPTRDSLKSRMEIIATLHGISIDDECVAFMEQSLTTHIKDVLTAIRQKVRFGPESVRLEADHVATRDNHSVEKSAGPRQIPLVRIQNTNETLFPPGKATSFFKPPPNSAAIGWPIRYSNGLAPTADVFSRSNANTPPSGPSQQNSPHLSTLKAKKGMQSSLSSSSKHTSSTARNPTTNRIAMEDMLFSYEFTPALYTSLPGAFDVAEKMLGALDHRNEEREPPHWRDISALHENSWSGKTRR
ncbi:hypothetical protein HDU67_007407 [Dinochytrium kinnereticum]|nr:hypothetical protein HDU67_007407 [Dinochytrium kinnereticum]